MNKSNKKLIFLAAIILVSAVFAGIIYGTTSSSSNDMKNDMKMDDNAPPATKEQKEEFISQWKKAMVEAEFNPDQLAKLTRQLESSTKKLEDNFIILSEYREKQKKASGDETAKMKKRVDLTESERDVIISRTQIELKEFLNKDQLNLIMMAGFHGASISMSGENHSPEMNNDPKMSQSKLDQMTMDLGKMVEPINWNCEAVSLKLILANLKS